MTPRTWRTTGRSPDNDRETRRRCEVAVSGRLVVEKMNAVVRALNWKCFVTDPTADCCRKVVDRPQRVVVQLTRRRDALQDFQQAVAARLFPRAEIAVWFQRSKVTLEEIRQVADVF